VTEYGITWSGTRHIVGPRGLRPRAACNATIYLYTHEKDGERPSLQGHFAKFDKAPICKRCAKIDLLDKEAEAKS
jgi:hypothetical protein